MVANVDITRSCRAIVLATNRAVVRDLEVSAPPNFMSFRRVSFCAGAGDGGGERGTPADTDPTQICTNWN